MSSGIDNVTPAGSAVSRVLERNPLLARALRNVLHLAGGNASAIVLGMVTLALMAHMLGPLLLGIFAMIESYGKLVDQLVRLETWQAVIRYGAHALEEKDTGRFAQLIKFTIAVDLAGAVMAAMVALLAIPVAARLLGWNADTILMARFYCIAVLTGVSSTPIGILRLFDRFAQVAWLDPAIAIVRLLAVLAAWTLGGSLWTIIILSILLQCLHRAMLSWMAWRELRRHGCPGPWSASLRGTLARFPGIWRLTLATNATALIRKSTQELDVLIVGGMAGAASAGVYQLVRKITLTAMKAGAMVQQVAFPDLARLWARRDTAGFVTLIGQIELITFAFALTFVGTVAVIGDLMITVIAGSRFQEAAVPLVVQSIAAFLFLAGSALRSALLTMGFETRLLGIVSLSAAGFYLALFLAIPRFGVAGASGAHVIFNLILLPAAILLFASALRRAAGSSACPHPTSPPPADPE